MFLIDEIYNSLDTWGNNPVFVECNQDGSENLITVGTFRNRIEDLIHFFTDAGITERVLVPIFIDNCWEYPAIFLALVRIGAIPVLAKKAFRRIELEHIFSNANPSVIISDDDYLEQLNSLVKDCLTIVRKDGRLTLKGIGTPIQADTAPGTVSVNYTYRGYGYPLGAMIGESGYLDAARRFQHYVRFDPGDRVLALLPMNHIFTMISSVILPLLNRITIYIIKTLHPKDVLNLLRNGRINCLSTVPEILMLLAKLKNKDEELPNLKVLVCGGSFLSSENHRFISERFSVEILNGYGLTEIAPITANFRNQGKIGTLGEFCSGLTGKIEQSADIQNGEILVKSDKSFLGYLGEPEKTADVMKGEWFRTGDSGRIVDGHVVFSGEIKRTRKVNGQLVDLKEVETALKKTGMVRKSTVSGETNHIHADIELSAKAGSDEREIIRSIRIALGDFIAAYKVPRTFKIV
ncbi:MAG: acyl--CoA ligase [Spirochaetaceae bacterium]|nr:acyl--CoA ligase [Spirochaetaceae bacterium]